MAKKVRILVPKQEIGNKERRITFVPKQELGNKELKISLAPKLLLGSKKGKKYNFFVSYAKIM